jgi:hypothetical protein
MSVHSDVDIFVMIWLLYMYVKLFVFIILANSGHVVTILHIWHLNNYLIFYILTHKIDAIFCAESLISKCYPNV